MAAKYILLFFLTSFLAVNGMPATSLAADAGTDSQFGWLHGNCLAIKQAHLELPQKITLARLDDPMRIDSGTITHTAVSADQCHALMSDRAQTNKSSGYSFYVVETSQPVNLAIGMLNGLDAGKFDFSSCSTSEGMVFSVSNKKSVIWKGYYYLGYDTEATCPDTEQ